MCIEKTEQTEPREKVEQTESTLSNTQLLKVILASNSIMFIVAQLNIGASIVFDGDLLYKHVLTPSFMDFGLIDSVANMWNAKV